VPTDALAITPLILAVVLAISAAGKLRTPRTSAEAFRDLRVPAPLASRVVVQGLPWGELALAVLLVAAGGWLGVVAAVAALLLFAAYLALVVRALGFEESVDCACFGEFAPGRITKRTVWRNVWLVVLAVGALALSFQGGSPLTLLLGDRVALAWFLAALAAALTTYLITVRAPEPSQAQGESLVSAEHFDDYVRTITPALPVTLGDGTETDLRALSAQRAQLLLFVSETCGSCSDVIAAAPVWRQELPQVDVRLVVSAQPDASAITSKEEPLSVHDPAYRLPGSFGFRGTPTALLLGADGMLAGGPVTGSTAVPEFVADVRNELGTTPAEF
jgi:hypothetical protein